MSFISDGNFTVVLFSPLEMMRKNCKSAGEVSMDTEGRNVKVW